MKLTESQIELIQDAIGTRIAEWARFVADKKAHPKTAAEKIAELKALSKNLSAGEVST